MADIRKFFKQGGCDSEERETDCLQLEKRRQQQKEYDQKKRKRPVIDTWLEEFDWVDVVDGILYCKVCKEFSQLSDPKSSLVVGIKEKHRKESLKWHNKSLKHVNCVEHKKALANPTQTKMAKTIKKVDEKNSELYEKLFNSAYYIAVEGDSFTKFPKLCALQAKNGIDMGKNYLNDKACRNFCISAAEVLKEESLEEIENARFISVLSDGSTDKGIREQELVYVRFVGSTGEIQTKLSDIVDLEHGHAQGVKDGILKGLESVGITREILAEKLIGVNTDGASVNLGKKGGAVKLLLDEVNEQFEDGQTCNEYITVVHCVAHNLELAICDAKKGCNYLKDFESILKGIFQLYYYSPKRRRELYDIAVSLDQELKHYGGVQQIRWVASQKRALTALLNNYDITIVHLEDIASGRDESSVKAKAYLKELKSERFLTFLHFMIDWTNLLSEVSVLFQQK